MKIRKRTVVAGGVVAACLVMGTAGVVAAEGVQGRGPASVLQNLVANGTITQDQADKIAKAFKDHREEMQDQRQQKRGELQQQLQARRDAMDAVITKTLGITEDQLQQARKDGKSLKELAGDKRDALIDALTNYANNQIDQAVKDGKLTQDRADKLKAHTKDMVTKRVDGKPLQLRSRFAHRFGGPAGTPGQGNNPPADRLAG